MALRCPDCGLAFTWFDTVSVSTLEIMELNDTEVTASAPAVVV